MKLGEFREPYVGVTTDTVILSEAAEGTGSAERAETRKLSPNNNASHERPAPYSLREGEDIVRTPAKAGECHKQALLA